MQRTSVWMAVGLAVVATLATQPGATQTRTVEVVSSPPHLVTTPGVLVRVRGAGTNPVGWASNDTLITPFYQDEEGDWFGWIGLMDLLLPDPNQLLFVVPDWRNPNAEVQLSIAVHAPDQRLFTGPRPPPAPCQNEAAGFGPAADPATCAAPRTITYVYKNAAGTWARFPLGAARPADAARTTISSGRDVPLIVRVETGVINRAPYFIALLDDPTVGPQSLEPGRPWPRTSWNGTLVYGSGGRFAMGAQSGTRVGPVDLGRATVTASCIEALLGRGYAVAAAQTILGPAEHDIVAGETLLRVREHFIKRYALPRATIGIGAGEPAAALARIARAYPGLDAVGAGNDPALTAASASCG
jgi:hypothetical protein